MTTPDQPIVGAPCWVDLLTSDAERSRAFYGELLGWEALEPSAEFGGYFMFTKDGAPVAGCMGSGPDSPVTDVWSVYLTSDDTHKTVAAAEAHGGQVLMPPTDIADLGIMAIVSDAGGAAVGVWQPGTFKGSALISVPGAPAWFEVLTRDYDASVAFYRDVFGWVTTPVSDAPGFSYTTLGEGDSVKAGIMDASQFLPDGVPAHWSTYFAVTDTDVTLAQVVDLGGSVLTGAEDTPYGRMATVADANGASFKVVAGA